MAVGGLNPCSNGILKYYATEVCQEDIYCLNPCSNGILKYNNVEVKFDEDAMS